MQKQKPVEKRLVYRSTARQRLSGPSLGALNRAARFKNAQLRVTGLLLYCQGDFFGVLEGDVNAVDHVAARVARDTRHGNLRIERQVRISARAFPTWRMAVTHLNAVPSRLRSGMFAMTEILPPHAALRGEDKEVRNDLRRFLASFATLDEVEPMRRAG